MTVEERNQRRKELEKELASIKRAERAAERAEENRIIKRVFGNEWTATKIREKLEHQDVWHRILKVYGTKDQNAVYKYLTDQATIARFRQIPTTQSTNSNPT